MTLSKKSASKLNGLLLFALIMPHLSFGNYANKGKKVGKGAWHATQVVSGLLMASFSFDKGVYLYRRGLDSTICLAAAVYVAASYTLMSTGVEGFKKLLGKEPIAIRPDLSKKQKVAKGLWAVAQLGCCRHIFNDLECSNVFEQSIVACIVGTLVSNSAYELKDLWDSMRSIENNGEQVDGAAQELNN
jgi:hypothetical protein